MPLKLHEQLLHLPEYSGYPQHIGGSMDPSPEPGEQQTAVKPEGLLVSCTKDWLAGQQVPEFCTGVGSPSPSNPNSTPAQTAKAP